MATDVRGKIVEAVSPYGLAAYQLQWHEFMLEGINFLEEALQVGSIAVRPGPAGQGSV